MSKTTLSRRSVLAATKARDEEWTPGNETYVPIYSERDQVGYSVLDARSRRLKRVVMFEGPR